MTERRRRVPAEAEVPRRRQWDTELNRALRRVAAARPEEREAVIRGMKLAINRAVRELLGE